MLTVDPARFPVGPGTRSLDVGCGAGRHAFDLLRRGSDVVALDLGADDLPAVTALFAALRETGEAPATARGAAVRADLTRLPFPDATFDRVVASEVLEHIPDDRAAIAEVVRVLRPGGLAALTVPRAGPERVCWSLSADYHSTPGGHVRIYAASALTRAAQAAGLQFTGSHHAHALHTPYWWLKCAVGVRNDRHPVVRAYHRLLVWDITKAPALTRRAERALNPVLGKSVVLYFRKPADTAADRPAADRPAADRPAADRTAADRTAAAAAPPAAAGGAAAAVASAAR